MDISKRLFDFLNAQTTMPFLFVGSGLSRRYLGLEDWESLLNRFSENLPHSFNYYKGKSNQNLPQAASIMSEDFYDKWFEEDIYADSRENFEKIVNAQHSPLKIEISKYIGNVEVLADLEDQLIEEIDLLKSSNVDGIITTNWDTFLEKSFPDFDKYIGQEEILFNNHQSIAEIFKIHGCSSQPNSLILTQEDYDRYEEKNAYLAAKLLTIFVDHPIIFLGYSLTDKNIQNILSKIFACLNEEKIDIISERLIFVEWDRDNEGDLYEKTSHSINSHRISLRTIRTSDYRQIFEPLTTIERRYPAKILKNIKEKIYELVLTNDPKNKLSVVDIEEVEDFAEVDIVMGIGIKSQLSEIGYTSFQINDIVDDIINNDNEWDHERILRDTLPQLSRNRRYLPIFKYLSREEYYNDDGEIDIDKIPDRLKKYVGYEQDDFCSIKYWNDQKDQINQDYNSLEELIDDETEEHCLYMIPQLEQDKIDTERLGDFLRENIDFMESTNSMQKTYFISLVHYYDYLVHHVNA